MLWLTQWDSYQWGAGQDYVYLQWLCDVWWRRRRE